MVASHRRAEHRFLCLAGCTVVFVGECAGPVVPVLALVVRVVAVAASLVSLVRLVWLLCVVGLAVSSIPPVGERLE